MAFSRMKRHPKPNRAWRRMEANYYRMMVKPLRIQGGGYIIHPVAKAAIILGLLVQRIPECQYPIWYPGSGISKRRVQLSG